MIDTFEITVDGISVSAKRGDTVASALLRSGQPPPMFCAIGICQLCCVLIDDAVTEACRTRVYPGLTVTRL